ncbi:MAG: efflux RND transporter permease subunit, partial [Calditrichia bacterium]
MLCSKILRPLHGGSNSWATRSFDNFFAWLDNVYRKSLLFALRGKWFIISGAVLIMLLGIGFFLVLPQELIPTEDRGVSFGIMIAPEGSTLDYTDRYMQQLESILLPLPEREGLFTATGLGFGGPGRVTNG